MLNIGTLIALLKLQDEMSPALLDVSKRLDSFGSAATSAGLALTAGLTVPITAVVYAAVDAGSEFQAAMNQIQGVLTPTAAEMELVRQTALRMGADTIFSATDSATAILELGKAGFTTAEAIAAVGDVLNLAAASGWSMQAAAEMAARTLNAFGLEVSDLAHVNDVLAAAVNQSSLELSDLQTAFAYVGPIAQGFGLSIEQVSAALALMRDAGIAAETAGRSLRDALSDLANPVGATRDAMEALGIETFKTTDGALMPFAEIIDLLHDKGLTAAEAMQLFGKMSGPAMYELVSQGRQALDELTLAFADSEGAAKAMADAMMQGLPGALEYLSGSVDTLFITLSKQLEPTIIGIAGVLESAADFLTEYVIPAFSELPMPVQLATFALFGLGAAIGPLLVIVGGMAFGVSSIITLLGTLGLETGAATGALAFLGKGFLAVGVAVGTFTATLALLDWSGLSNWIEYASLRVQRFFGLIDSGATNQDLWNSVMANTARRLGEAAAASANTYDEVAKLPGGTTMAEIEFNEILAANSARLATNTEAVDAAAEAMKQWQAAAARAESDALNAQGLFLLERDAKDLALRLTEVDDAIRIMDVDLNTLAISGATAGSSTYDLANVLKAGALAAADISVEANNASQQVVTLGQRLQEDFIGVMAAIPDLIRAAFTGGGGLEGAIAAVASLSGQTFAVRFLGGWNSEAENIEGGLFDGLSGALGAVVGNMIPIVGSLVGPLVSAIGDAFTRSGGEDVMRRVGHDWGVAITEELGDAINETAEALFGGDRQAAELFHMADLIEAAGGINDLNFDTFVGKLHDVFSMIETGMFTGAQAADVLTENFSAFLDSAIDGSGRLSPALVEIMELTARFALESEELAQTYAENITTLIDALDLGIAENFTAATGMMQDLLGLVAAGTLSAADAAQVLDDNWQAFIDHGLTGVGLLKPELYNLVQAARELGIESEAIATFIDEQLNMAVDGLNQRVSVFGDVIAASLEDGIGASERLDFVLKTLGTDAGGLQKEFDNLGVYTVATFGALISEGYGLRDALDLIGDSLDQLAQAEHVFGLEGSAALQQLLGFREIVTENEDIFAALDGIQQMMVGLANTGYLTQEVFSAFGDDIVTQFERLAARGVDANQALLLMQPSLQTLWELQHNFGFEVDDATQGLLDQAEAAGIIGGAFQDVMEQIKDILLGIAQALGADIPDYLKQTTDATQDELAIQAAAWDAYYGQVAQASNDFYSDLMAKQEDIYRDISGGFYEPGMRVGGPFSGPSTLPPGYDYNNPGMVPGGSTGGACGCGVTIGPVIVSDGTSPAVGQMFLDALYAEVMRGGGMTKFRKMLCEAAKC